MKKVWSILLVLVICASVLPGCSNAEKAGKSENEVVISVGTWPQESNPAERARYEAVAEQLSKDYPHIKVVESDFTYDERSYLPQAASGQLPTVYRVPFTELDKIVDAGFATDITEYVEEAGFTKAYNPQILDLTTRDGKQYVVASDTYTMGFALNKDLFKKAGLVNEDGSLMIPQTYDDVKEFSKIIKEKTGAYGFGMVTKNGWHMLNLAWSFGTVFEQKVDGEWKATFGSEEFVDSLEYLRDMKAEGLFPPNALIDTDSLYRMFVTDQLAMMYYVPSTNQIIENYGMNKDKIAYAAVPEGPAGRYTQMGGSLYIIDSNATPEQVDACLKWIQYIGHGPELNEQTKATIESKYKGMVEKGYIVGVTPYPVWSEDTEIQKYIEETIAANVNVDTSYYTEYMDYTKATAKPEEPINCRELYTVIGDCMQEALANPNADLSKLVKEAAENFQRNALENME